MAHKKSKQERTFVLNGVKPEDTFARALLAFAFILALVRAIIPILGVDGSAIGMGGRNGRKGSLGLLTGKFVA
jgi:hypothetical protein